MARIPVRFSRVAAAFDSVAARLCESSGSDHSPEIPPADLSDLVNSFMEREFGSTIITSDDEDLLGLDDLENNECNKLLLDCDYDDDKSNIIRGGDEGSERKELLRNLVGENGEDDVKRKIVDEFEIGFGVCGQVGSSGFKRRLMTFLRNKGFDAGLCKSKWEKSKRFPAGDYEYVDVNVKGTRYIVEANIAAEFEIARSTENYTSLLQIFPPIFVGRVGELKQIVRLMSNAMRQSMKANEMPIPPWRKNCYMQAKWFGSYKRTTKPYSSSLPLSLSKKPPSDKIESRQDFEYSKRLIGFEFDTSAAMLPFCRDGFATKVGFRVSNLTAALN